MQPKEQLAAAASLLLGEAWQRPLARLLEVDDRLVRRWASGDRPVPPWAMHRLSEELAKHREAITEALESLPRAPLTLRIPEGIAFQDLRLGREPVTREVSFDWKPILRICEASGIDPDVFRRGPEDNVAALIVAWYRAHLREGGEPDPVAEQLGAEVEAEDRYGAVRVQVGSGEPQ